MTYEQLRQERRIDLGVENAMEVSGVVVHKGNFIDTAEKALEHLLSADVWLDFEIAKVESRGYRQETRRLKATQRDVRQAGERLLALKDTLKEITS